jgi:hypothetical protein
LHREPKPQQGTARARMALAWWSSGSRLVEAAAARAASHQSRTGSHRVEAVAHQKWTAAYRGEAAALQRQATVHQGEYLQEASTWMVEKAP